MADYCTLADVHLRMSELGTGDDAFISALITSVSTFFDSQTGQTFAAEAAGIRLFSGKGTCKLFIRPPLSAAPTLVRVRDNTSGAWRTVPSGDIHLMPEGRATNGYVLWLELRDTITGTDSVWPQADESVEITGPWTPTAVPTDIKEACAETVVNLYRSRGSAGADMESGIGGTYMPDIPKAIPAFAWKVLQAYNSKLVFA